MFPDCIVSEYGACRAPWVVSPRWNDDNGNFSTMQRSAHSDLMSGRTPSQSRHQTGPRISSILVIMYEITKLLPNLLSWGWISSSISLYVRVSSINLNISWLCTTSETTQTFPRHELATCPSSYSDTVLGLTVGTLS